MNEASRGPRKLVIVGDSAFAEIAHEYFTHDSDYEVRGFAVERAFLERDSLAGLPVVAFEDLEQHFAPSDHSVFVALTYAKMNRVRTRLYLEAKARGYAIASYVSSAAFVWRNVTLGENVFVFENNVLQPFLKVGNNVVLWSGNHIGHHSVIRDNCFIASHVVISGFCDIGANTFMGVNCTIANNVEIGQDNWIGPGVSILKSTEPGALYWATRHEPAKVSALRFFKVENP